MLRELSRETLAEQIARQLGEYIVAEDLKPGEMLPSETRLAEQFGVSRPVVREALRSLAGQGVIEVVSGKGALVRPMDNLLLNLYFRRAIQIERGTLLELMQARRVIEVECAALAAANRTEEELEGMRATLDKLRGTLEDREAYAQANLEFHSQIAAASHNSVLCHLVESILKVMKEALFAGARRRGPQEMQEDVHSNHEILLKMIEAQDVDGVREAMHLHFEDAFTGLEKLVRQGTKPRSH